MQAQRSVLTTQAEVSRMHLLFLVHHISNIAQGSILRILISFRSSAISWKGMSQQTQLNRYDN